MTNLLSSSLQGGPGTKRWCMVVQRRTGTEQNRNETMGNIKKPKWSGADNKPTRKDFQSQEKDRPLQLPQYSFTKTTGSFCPSF